MDGILIPMIFLLLTTKLNTSNNSMLGLFAGAVLGVDASRSEHGDKIIVCPMWFDAVTVLI